MSDTIYERTLGLITTIVESVDDVGHVYGKLLIFRQEREFLDKLKVRIGDTDQYRGWLVTSRPTDPVVRKIITPSQDEETLAFQLHGYRSINADQSSEVEFRALSERLCDALSAKIRAGEQSDISDLIGYVAIAMPAQLKVFKLGLIGGVWCHYALVEYALKVHVKVTRE